MQLESMVRERALAYGKRLPKAFDRPALARHAPEGEVRRDVDQISCMRARHAPRMLLKRVLKPQLGSVLIVLPIGSCRVARRQLYACRCVRVVQVYLARLKRGQHSAAAATLAYWYAPPRPGAVLFPVALGERILLRTKQITQHAHQTHTLDSGTVGVHTVTRPPTPPDTVRTRLSTRARRISALV
jgi:hypothetical protein